MSTLFGNVVNEYIADEIVKALPNISDAKFDAIIQLMDTIPPSHTCSGTCTVHRPGGLADKITEEAKRRLTSIMDGTHKTDTVIRISDNDLRRLKKRESVTFREGHLTITITPDPAE